MEQKNGFSTVGIIIIIFGFSLFIFLAAYGFGRITLKSGVENDATTSERLEMVRQRLSEFVTENKTIPTDLEEESGVSYSRKDNQTAELCASFNVQKSSINDNFISPNDVFEKYTGAGLKTTNVYRDEVDFYGHRSGRNCYSISYEPINVAYESQFNGDNSNWSYCDALRQYNARFTAQTIKGFVIGGSFTSDPGGGRFVLAEDVDAYDQACVKIPISALNVGDKVEFGVEDGPVNGDEKTFFIKAIKIVQ